jgi:hypothetical protein
VLIRTWHGTALPAPGGGDLWREEADEVGVRRRRIGRQAHQNYPSHDRYIQCLRTTGVEPSLDLRKSPSSMQFWNLKGSFNEERLHVIYSLRHSHR